jgi:hypothetical protein
MYKSIYLLRLLLVFLVRETNAFSQSLRTRQISCRTFALQPLQSKEDNIYQIEKDVFSSVQERLDYQRLMTALEEPSASDYTPPWKIAVAAATTFSVLIFFFSSSNVFLSTIVWIATYAAANRDPLEEEGLAGPLTRLVGRRTLESYKANEPKIKALARVVVTGREEITQLQHRVAQLEEENKHLREWKEKRIKVDRELSRFSLDELRFIARHHNLPSGGNKTDLLMLLVERKVIHLG